jgi:hypothetical protein
MKNQDLFNQLQNIAAQSSLVNNPKETELVDSYTEKEQINKLREIKNQAITMFPESGLPRFNFWKKQIDTTGMTKVSKQTYWKDYEQIHPDGIVGAKRDFVDITKKELEYIESPVAKEFFLRERLDNTPDWAKKEFEPLLGELSSIVANSNYAKAQQVYMKDLDVRATKLAALSELDPDISIETHTNDLLKLEQMNLMELTKVKQGRVGVFNKLGNFVPAFGITDRNSILEDDVYGSPSIEEQIVIRNLAPTIIKKAIQGNLAVARNKILSNERTSISVAEQYLKQGDFDFDKWDTAFSMLHNISIYDKLKMGLQGEIKSGRIKTEEDLRSIIYRAVSKYIPAENKENK